MGGEASAPLAARASPAAGWYTGMVPPSAASTGDSATERRPWQGPRMRRASSSDRDWNDGLRSFSTAPPSELESDTPLFWWKRGGAGPADGVWPSTIWIFSRGRCSCSTL